MVCYTECRVQKNGVLYGVACTKEWCVVWSGMYKRMLCYFIGSSTLFLYPLPILTSTFCHKGSNILDTVLVKNAAIITVNNGEIVAAITVNNREIVAVLTVNNGEIVPVITVNNREIVAVITVNNGEIVAVITVNNREIVAVITVNNCEIVAVITVNNREIVTCKKCDKYSSIQLNHGRVMLSERKMWS